MREWARDGLGMSREQKMQMKKEKWAMVLIVCAPVHFFFFFEEMGVDSDCSSTRVIIGFSTWYHLSSLYNIE